jgi:hypothetical protein
MFLKTKFEVLTEARITIMVSWDVMPCALEYRCQSFGGLFCPEDGGSRFLPNTDTHLQNYEASDPRRHNISLQRAYLGKSDVVFTFYFHLTIFDR